MRIWHYSSDTQICRERLMTRIHLCSTICTLHTWTSFHPDYNSHIRKQLASLLLQQGLFFLYRRILQLCSMSNNKWPHPWSDGLDVPFALFKSILALLDSEDLLWDDLLCQEENWHWFADLDPPWCQICLCATQIFLFRGGVWMPHVWLSPSGRSTPDLTSSLFIQTFHT